MDKIDKKKCSDELGMILDLCKGTDGLATAARILTTKTIVLQEDELIQLLVHFSKEVHTGDLLRFFVFVKNDSDIFDNIDVLGDALIYKEKDKNGKNKKKAALRISIGKSDSSDLPF